MTYNEVIDIMGAFKDTLHFSLDTSNFYLFYESPLGYSDHFYIGIDNRDSIVVHITDGL